MINTSSCNADRLPGCARDAADSHRRRVPASSRRRPSHRTPSYVAEPRLGLDRHRLGDRRHAPATPHQLPAARHLQTLQVPAGNPDDIAVDSATDTIYVATITSSGPDLVSVFNGATCNATDTGGCGQTPATLAVGSSGDAPEQLHSQPRRQPGDQHDLRVERLQHRTRQPAAVPRQQRLRDQRRDLRRG